MQQRISRPRTTTITDESVTDRARRRAISFLEREELGARRAADGGRVGIQAILARADDSEVQLDLNMFLDAMVVSGSALDTPSLTDDPARESWREIADMAAEKLGFPIEPELFSNMLFVAYLGRDPDPTIRALAGELLTTFRDKHVDGLYHFFVSLKFACDIDCTAMAARARLAIGDIDPSTASGAQSLRTITNALLRSAAVCDVAAEDNMTHGKSNGPLVKHVLKVYLDDHVAQPPGLDRGLKINPVVVSNALGPILLELKLGLRKPDEIIDLREYVEGLVEPRTARATVAEIVAANVAYVNAFLLDGEWRNGCRYYPSPDAFLCSYSENLREFPELFEQLGAFSALREAIRERRQTEVDDIASDPTVSLNIAFRAIAAANVRLDSKRELDALMSNQQESGAWTDFDCLYSFGGGSSIPIHFRSPLLTTAFAIRGLSPVVPRESVSGGFRIGSTGWIDAIISNLV